MKGIGGNLTAEIQIYTTTTNEIGENVKEWVTVQSLRGWLDLLSSHSQYSTFNTKLQTATNLFISDYVPLDERITTENSRMVIKGKRYDINYIDNPMELCYGSQLEIYLKFTGGQ